MPKFYKNSDEILRSIKRRVVIPESQNLFTDQDLLDFATEEIDSHIVALINTQQENYFLTFETVQIVPGQTRYTIPYRATGNKLKDLAFVPANETPRVKEMSEIDLGDLPSFDRSYSNSEPYIYYVAGNEICLVPETNNFTGYLRFGFYLRTNALVPLEEVAVISSIDTTLGVVTVSNIPEKFTVEDLYDFVMEKSPHKIISYDNAITGIDLGTKQITFGPGNLPSGLAKGDHLCLATETAIPNIPSDLHNMVCHRAGARVLEAIGDTEALQVAELKTAQLEKKAADLIDNRVETAARKIVNRHGTLRNGLSRYKRRGTW